MRSIIFLLVAFMSSGTIYGAGEKTVFNKYKREQVFDSKHSENRIIGQLGEDCTATLIGPRHVLTAAHCVYDIYLSEWKPHLIFNPGKIGPNSTPYKEVQWSRAFIPSSYDINDYKYEYDFAVIELSEEIGNTLGWATLKVANGKKLSISFAGYPGDKEMGTLWRVNCPATLDSDHILHMCDTFGGMSGSAVFDQRDKKINGIHVFGDTHTNGAMRITSERLKLINSWLKGVVNSQTKMEVNKHSLEAIELVNNCSEAIEANVYFRKGNLKWNNQGKWSIPAFSKVIVGQTNFPQFYLYGKGTNSAREWKGDISVSYDWSRVPMFMIEGEKTYSFNCKEGL